MAQTDERVNPDAMSEQDALCEYLYWHAGGLEWLNDTDVVMHRSAWWRMLRHFDAGEGVTVVAFWERRDA